MKMLRRSHEVVKNYWRLWKSMAFNFRFECQSLYHQKSLKNFLNITLKLPQYVNPD